MHAKGSGAHGTFTVTHDITRYTKAKIFSQIGKQTPMFARFSTVAGERGAADAERDIRGFALKFYTEEGNWDMVGNNTPVFFFRDPLRFPDLNNAIKRDPPTGMRSADNNWDFWSLLPEALHQVTIVMSERGIPKSFRHTHGFGSHAYSFINAANERIWVKFHFRTQQGLENLTDAEAEARVGKDRESCTMTVENASLTDDRRKAFVLQEIQPDLLGLMDGSVSTLVPIFATAGLTGRPLSAFFVGLAASLGAAISMGLSEALSDDGSVTGRGSPLRRGAITGVATGIGGMLHTLPFLIPTLDVALKLAYAVVVCELLAISFIRYRSMGGRLASTIVQVIVGGGIVFAIGVWLGRIGAS